MSEPVVLITGLGLMGGSLAGALSGAGWKVLLHHRRNEVAHAAQGRGWGQAIQDLCSAAQQADLAVVAVPVSVIPALVRNLAEANPRLVATDVGSAKGAICAELVDLASQGRFVGSHPMCGSHLQGLDHADPALYRNAITVLTPARDCPDRAIHLTERLWAAAGSRCLRMEPDEHDAAVAEASHLPHVLAATAAALLGPSALPLAASGFRDTTRVAAGSAALWRDILAENREAVLDQIEKARDHLAALERALQHRDAPAIEAWLEAGRQGRLRFDRRG